MKKQILGLVLTLCILTVFTPHITTAAITDSGQCGETSY